MKAQPFAQEDVWAEAIRRRQMFDGPVIAVTGSSGKTTTKLMLTNILSRVGKVLSTPYECVEASCIARYFLYLAAPYQAAIVKIGAVSRDEVRRAAELVRPTIGIVTNVGEVHTGRLGGVEQVVEAKGEVVRAIAEGGVAVLNKENEFTSRMERLATERGVQVLKFGVSRGADVRADQIRHLGPEGTEFMVRSELGPDIPLHMRIYSLGDVYNALAAVAAAQWLRVSSDHIRAALEGEGFSLPPGRGRLLELGKVRVIDDTYDANPQSLIKTSATLVNFAPYSRRLVMVLGEMGDLGENVEERHRAAGQYLSKMPIDVIVCVGEGARPIAEGATSGASPQKAVLWLQSLEEATELLRHLVHEGDTVLVEGSARLNMSVIIESLITHFGRKG
ncbi:MAG: UDP-N-acetylmuramoyl-tripeptide--D-alanyl-D-alanine ligase [candidate division KSB1 bacterium]|nr:UDP-N-acetylmuramoyl-tripeptide--D-alanyl-D-alanine ligase [candidate division KSB1 bacterium]